MNVTNVQPLSNLNMFFSCILYATINIYTMGENLCYDGVFSSSIFRTRPPGFTGSSDEKSKSDFSPGSFFCIVYMLFPIIRYRGPNADRMLHFFMLKVCLSSRLFF